MATAIDAFTLPEELSRLGRNFYAIAYLDEQEQQSLSLENPIAWLADLEIGLGIWEGVFEDVPGYWLR
jgi:hypothetical protein